MDQTDGDLAGGEQAGEALALAGSRYGMPLPEQLDGVGGPARDIVELGDHRQRGHNNFPRSVMWLIAS
ncbi:hypothetical protein [Nonomuraea sp. NPDC049695]|uniref:hypothetical protein n=1 Tax=Nonomuraea sp. NPDC049695 TaxID=3154734 RepID=UPI00342AEEEF